MNIITKVMKKIEYKHYLKKFEEALYYANRVAGSTSTHQGYANEVNRNLTKMMEIECELNG